ncbi:CCAAT/enhancer-binding protein zeta [Dissostichus eleginoides]|uniref:CCAAT/enhancer-binding protein zeta n=1 Tax=Dissostichus eleginoides TaxID=100907 RepID=A0AAD9F619_DISEL|nr:CCAAT/enhancer-binding protein zeta [Dissostichus eleginoides]
MAAKNKQRKKSKAGFKVSFQPAKDDMEAENSGGEEGEDPAEDGRKDKGKKGEEEEFNLDDVLRLGGTQADYVLLAGLNDENELVDGGKKGAIDDLEEGELEKFIQKLGIRSIDGLQIIPDEPEENAEETEMIKGIKEGKESNKAKEKEAAAAKEQTSSVPPKPRKILLIRPGGKWFDLEYTAEGATSPQDPSLISQYKALAVQLYEADQGLYKSKKNLQKGANSNWMKTVVSSGVLADRMAAMTVLIQDAPVHTLEHVENLVAMVKKKGSRRQGLMALDTLRELLLSDLLPENRKLRSFAEHPFDQLEEKASGNKDARDRRLILWYFEHHLKHHVAEFVAALDSVAHDTVAATKAKALATAHEMLCSRPEQERALLMQVVNKLGDPEYKTAAKASHFLESLIHKHPNMKAVVSCEVERLMFRPNINPKAQYYAVCFLSQVMLSHDEADLAAKLITIYFSFFRACVKKKDIESKMLSALLSGVNRAYPYAGSGDEKVKEQLDTLFKVVHLVKFNTAVQALMLLFQVMDSQQSISDRYYVALYSMFLNLLYKSLKADIVVRRVKAFVKRLLQVSAEQSASFTCGALFLVSEVMKSKPALKILLLEDGEEEASAEPKEEEASAEPKEEEASAEPQEAKPSASWVHHQNLEGKSIQSYDPLHRNPLFCGADHTTLWELQRLAAHFHPSVSLFAKTILEGGSILYSGDPLQDFTLIRFLDRFVFRNPKQMKGKQNTDSSALTPKQRFPLKSVPVNCEEFLTKEESQIPVDEIFFHRFFRKRHQEKQLKIRRPRADGDNESVEDVDDEEFEKMLDSCEGDSYFTETADDDLDFAGNVKFQSWRTMHLVANSDDEMEVPDITPLTKKGKRKSSEEPDSSLGPKQGKRKKGKKDTAMFASAEEFGSMLDENAGSKFDNTGLNAMANSDKAGLKQLKWEANRDDWMQDRDAKTMRKKKTMFNKNKKAFGRPRTGGKTFGKRK